MSTERNTNMIRLCCVLTIGIFFSYFIFSLESCTPQEKEAHPYRINTAHLDTLYGEIKVGEQEVGYVHIYSEYPDYHMVGDDDEGFACVDDASRAAIFYLRQYAVSTESEHLRKAEMLLKFLLAMQAPNGYYYNFIWTDGSIHKEGVTSIAEPNWWSWRVLWAFSEAIDLLEGTDHELLSVMKAQRQRLVRAILMETSFRSDNVDTIKGIEIPMWMPGESGADQAALILMGLASMIEASPSHAEIPQDSLIGLMRHMADGIIMMQIHQKDSLQDGAFLSWANLWHAYGNSQAYALLKAGAVLKDEQYVNRALYELDHFYPALIKAGGLDFFWVEKTDSIMARTESQMFSQIAYGRRPMIFAAVEAYKITGDKKYLHLAQSLGQWFAGENIAQTAMYDPNTGRGFDGIISTTQINQNAGAESTIEALLSLQVLDMYYK